MSHPDVERYRELDEQADTQSEASEQAESNDNSGK